MDHKHVFAFLILCFSTIVHGKLTLSCEQTPHPQICTSFIQPNLLASNEAHFAVFHSITLKITLEQAREAHRMISSMNMSSFDERAKMAWEDCLELYENTVHHLNQTILTSSIDTTTLNNVHTYLSAAIANHETCKDGFIDLKLSSHLDSFPLILTNFSKLIANALAINKASITTLYESQLQTNDKSGRKLLANGFPEWISKADRRLLQSAAMATTRADLVVDKDGMGDYKTISQAIAASKKLRNGTKRFIIYVKKGVYEENVVITNEMKNLMLIGDDIDATIITGSRNVQDGSTTFRSATFAVSGEGFIAKGITFENTAGPQKHQAVALRSSSDFSVFFNCSFKAFQDTLYLHSLRQFYKNCLIHGTIDFIFGDASAILQTCRILLRRPMPQQVNTVTAQSRSDPNENTGFVIHDSIIGPAPDLVPAQASVRTFLGRPWRRYSRTVVMKSVIDGIVDPAGWAPWNGDFGIHTVYYGEYRNTGSGSGTVQRVRWPGFHVIVDPLEAGKFSVGEFLGGDRWIPASGVPFMSTL